MIFKVIILIAVYAAGFYSGIQYQTSATPKEATLKHLKDLGEKGREKGEKVLRVLQEE
jgi:hypothetical protein